MFAAAVIPFDSSGLLAGFTGLSTSGSEILIPFVITAQVDSWRRSKRADAPGDRVGMVVTMDDDKLLAMLGDISGLLLGLDGGQKLVRSEIANIRGDVTSEIGKVRGDVTSEIGKVRDDVTSEMGRIRDDLQSEIARTRGDLLTRMERFENRLTEFREDVVVAVGGNGALSSRVDSDRQVMADLTKMVFTMQQQMLRLRTRVDELEKPNAAG